MPEPETSPQNELNAGNRPPSLAQVLGIVLASYLVFLVFLHFAGGSYWSLVGGKFGDNPDYLEAASAIRHWQISGVNVKQFWGLSYAMACVSMMTGVSDTTALVAVCGGSSLVSVAICYWLWGGWIAAFFALLSLDWLQRSLLGGAEPLFMALLLGAFLALRRERWVAAAILASLATVVRPFGVFALLGLGIHLLYRRRFRDCAVATGIGLVIGGLYTWPLKHYLGNPFANVALYQTNDWHGRLPFQLSVCSHCSRHDSDQRAVDQSRIDLLLDSVCVDWHHSSRRLRRTSSLREEVHCRNVFCARVLPCTLYLRRSRLVSVQFSSICASDAALDFVFS